MFRAPKIAISLLLVLLAGTLVSACGEDRSHLLPGEDVQQIAANIDTVQQLVDEGQCFDALEATEAVMNQAESLPNTVDAKLKRSLIDGVVTLQILVGRQCDEDPAAGTTGTTGTTEPEEVETTPTGETGTTEEETGTTGPTGKKEKTEPPQKPDTPETPNKPSKEPKTPTPEPTPTPTPPETVPPVDTGPGSGGISPNP